MLDYYERRKAYLHLEQFIDIVPYFIWEKKLQKKEKKKRKNAVSCIKKNT